VVQIFGDALVCGAGAFKRAADKPDAASLSNRVMKPLQRPCSKVIDQALPWSRTDAGECRFGSQTDIALAPELPALLGCPPAWVAPVWVPDLTTANAPTRRFRLPQFIIGFHSGQLLHTL
jgi:hypothetical protein